MCVDIKGGPPREGGWWTQNRAVGSLYHSTVTVLFKCQGDSCSAIWMALFPPGINKAEGAHEIGKDPVTINSSPEHKGLC